MTPNLIANWPAPPNVHALTSTSSGQNHALSSYGTNNMAHHVGDNPWRVENNRVKLMQTLELQHEPAWLHQTHSNRCIVLGTDTDRDGDAAITKQGHQALAILTADCIPILLCNHTGTEIAAIHAGWRGLVDGIIENTVAKIDSPPATLMAWIGPHICGRCFGVGMDVQERYLQQYPFTSTAFTQEGTQIYANLAEIAELILNSLGIHAVFQSSACTFELKQQFYSYRRNSQTGRMATLIWFD